MNPFSSSADVEKLQDFHDQISSRVNVLEGLEVSAAEYVVVLYRVLNKALLLDLGILYRQRVNKFYLAGASDGVASTLKKGRQMQEILNFLHVKF